MPSKVITEKEEIFAKRFRDYLKKRSFNEANTLNTKALDEDDELRKIESLTIMVKVTIDDMKKGDDGKPKLVEVFGHSECQCWGLTIDGEGFSFGKKCE
jgi:hypothetical protein